MRSNRNKPWAWVTLIEEAHACCVRDPETGCLLWPYGADKDGYPKIYIEGKHWRGNRAVLYASTGVVGEAAMHACDTPPCLSLDHLSWGTHADNSRDAVKKGRHKFNVVPLSGEENGRSILSDEDRANIVTRVSAGESASAVASSYGVVTSTIARIAHQHGVEMKIERRKREWNISLAEARRRYEEGESLASLANACGLTSYHPVSSALRAAGVTIRPRGGPKKAK